MYAAYIFSFVRSLVSLVGQLSGEADEMASNLVLNLVRSSLSSIADLTAGSVTSLVY
jgi:hypothetical protein